MADINFKAGINSHLDIFQPGQVDLSISSYMYVPYYSLTNIRESQIPLEFTIPGATGIYIDLENTYIYLKVKLSKDGKTLPAGDDVSTTNFFVASLFEVFELYLQNKLVTCKNYYGYLSYLLVHLSYSSELKKDILKNGLYEEDNKASTISDVNIGYKSRKQYLKESIECELTGNLMEDFCMNQKWLIGGVDVRIKLKRASPEFCLLSPNTTSKYSIEFTEAILFVKKVIPHPKILELHEKTLERQPAIYPYTMTQLKALTIAKSRTSVVFENIYPSNKLPSLICIGLVDSASFQGKIDKNPYFFDSYSANNVSITVDNLSLEYRNLSLSYPSSYLLAFQTLVNGLNLERKSVGVNRSNYIDGNVFYVYQLTSNSHEPQSGLDQSGSLKIEITFAKALDAQVTAVLLSQSKAAVAINKYREVELYNQGVI